jgi:hypothetical protein
MGHASHHPELSQADAAAAYYADQEALEQEAYHRARAAARQRGECPPEAPETEQYRPAASLVEHLDNLKRQGYLPHYQTRRRRR